MVAAAWSESGLEALGDDDSPWSTTVSGLLGDDIFLVVRVVAGASRDDGGAQR